MLAWNSLVLILVVLAASGDRVDGETHHEETLQCVCTTRTCQELGEPVCTTAELCYSQYLNRNDGSNPVTKGCVNLKTPLLCENRPPKSSSARVRWPVLLCCRTNMCNQEDLRLAQLAEADRLGEEPRNSSGPPPTVQQSVLVLGRNNTLSNPTVLAVFCVGLAVLLAIGITGCCVLQRQRLY